MILVILSFFVVISESVRHHVNANTPLSFDSTQSSLSPVSASRPLAAALTVIASASPSAICALLNPTRAAMRPDEAALIGPHLQPVDLHLGTTLYRAQDEIKRAYLPHTGRAFAPSRASSTTARLLIPVRIRDTTPAHQH